MKEKFSESFVAQLNPITIASIGDGVHTLYVRTSLAKKNLPPDKLHSESSKLCRASFQAKIYEKLQGLLTEQERNVALRARNHKTHGSKNSSTNEYKKATAFEAIIGYLYLIGNEERLNEILKISTSQEEEC